MASHIVTLGLVHINSVGQAKAHTQMTIGETCTSSSEIRVLVDSENANTAGNPTVAAYLASEAADGFDLSHIDQTFLITSGTGTATPVARQATVAAWSSIAIPAGASSAHISVETNNAFIVPSDAEPILDGCSYKINGVYNISMAGATALYFKRDGIADGTISITFYN